VRPRPVTATSVPGLLALFQNEWDALMLETHTLKEHLAATRTELANALYQHDAACRVIARLARERDSALSQLSALQSSFAQRAVAEAAEAEATAAATGAMEVVCDQVRRLDRQISYGGSVHVQEMGYLARSFMNSAEGKAIAAECEARVVESGGVVDKDRKMDKHIRRYATGFPHQFRIVSQRVFVAVIRNPATSVFQVLSFVASAVLLGAFFQGRLNGGPTAMQAHIGAMFMVAYMIIFSAITSLELFIEERALFVHEKTSGFYRTSAYFLAKIACEILPTRMIPTLFYALITAFMAGLRTDFYHLAMYWLTLTVTSITSTSLCLLVSCATSVYSAAFLGCGAFYIIFMLASGFVLQADEIPSYLAPFKYLSFYRYCLQNLLALDLKGRTFDCPTPEQLMADPTLVSICLPSGDMYLQSQGIDPDNLWRNIGILAAMAPVYLLIAYLFLRALKKTT
ncbi:hypothetical protein VYU27_003952, partial [Nannochloropsis oceanica]